MRPRKNEGGFILLLTFAFLIVLVELTAAMTILISGETLDIGGQNDDKRLLYLADAGVERVLCEIRNDYTSTTQTGTADLRGSDTSGSINSGGATDFTQIRYLDGTTTEINSDSDSARLKSFDTNYANTRIVSVSLCARASRETGGATDPHLEVSYWIGGVQSATLLDAPVTTSLADLTPKDITSDRTWTWSTLLASNFELRGRRSSGSKKINLDGMYLRVTYAIDTLTEPWATGSYQTYPISLGAGTIQSVSITDEQGKVHLNTATQALLRYLMVELGVADATANTVATNIVNYQAGNNFDSVEELQQVTGMTNTIYELIKDTVTVYSFINTNVYANTASPRTTTRSRAPININTASSQVLRAVFDTFGIDASDVTSLASEIITTRATTPFTCFYSADSAVTTDFYDYALGKSYLSASGNPDQKDSVIDNADASPLIPVSGSSTISDSISSAEFCYDSGAFKIESVATVGGRSVRVKTILNNLGARTFSTFTGDTTIVGYRKENFE